MFTKPTADQLRLLQVLPQLPVWKPLQDILNAEIARTVDVLVDARDKTLTRMFQGRVQALRELKELLETSGSLLEKVERRPSGLGDSR